jgi:hypothetical protein
MDQYQTGFPYVQLTDGLAPPGEPLSLQVALVDQNGVSWTQRVSLAPIPWFVLTKTHRALAVLDSPTHPDSYSEAAQAEVSVSASSLSVADEAALLDEAASLAPPGNPWPDPSA